MGRWEARVRVTHKDKDKARGKGKGKMGNNKVKGNRTSKDKEVRVSGWDRLI